MKNMPKLFEVNLIEPNEVKSTKFISELQEMNFVDVNMTYLTNYIDARIDIALGHIKNGYERYVLEGNWTEDKYRDIIFLVSRDRKMMIPTVLLQYGIKYDDGKFKREIVLERRKYKKVISVESKKKIVEEKKEDLSKEEQELLNYIEKLNKEG